MIHRFKPTLTPHPGFAKEAAASRLYEALKSSHNGFEDVVIEVLTEHSYVQRNKIEKAYKYNHRSHLAVTLSPSQEEPHQRPEVEAFLAL